MKFVVLIGPDTLGVSRYKTRSGLRRALDRAVKSHVRHDSVSHVFRGRKYCAAEIHDATILTLAQYFRRISNLGSG